MKIQTKTQESTGHCEHGSTVLLEEDSQGVEIYNSWGACEYPGCVCQKFVPNGGAFGICLTCGHRDVDHKVI